MNFYSDFNMQHYDDEDSNHSVNGWIKKEVDDDEDMEDYIKQGQEGDPGDHYENLINLSKEELVGRVLQQEEDIRFLQDIRNGLEKAVQELSSSALQFRTLYTDLSGAVSSLKNQTALALPAPGDHASSSSAPTVSSSRPTVSSASDTSPRSTPGGNVPLSSPKTSSAQSNARSTQSSSQSYSAVATVVPPKERTHSFTITRSTNVVIKTEIPSPPPEPEVIENPVPSPVMGQMNFQKKRRIETQSSFQTQQQNQNSNSSSSAFQQNAASNRSFGPRGGKGNMFMPIPTQQTQQRPRMSTTMQSGQRAQYAVQKNNMQNFQMRHQPVQNVRMPSPRCQRGNPRMPMRGRGFQDSSFTGQMRPQSSASGMTNAPNQSRHVSHVKITPLPTTTANSPVNNTLADFAAKIKMPSGITLSIVPPGGGPAPKTQSKTVDSSSGVVALKSSDNTDKASSTPTSTYSSSSAPKSATVTKNVTNTPIPSSSTSSNNQPRTVINFGDDDDEDENDYDEIAVLIPDKKTLIAEEDADNNSSKDSQVMLKKNARSAEVFSQQAVDTSTNWTSQNAQSGQNTSEKMYHNNAEYLFDDPLDVDDTDTEENDSKFYLGEDVSLPKEVVDKCIKEGPNPEQLTRNLMTALFPDLQQIAASWDGTLSADKLYTALPTNKVHAVIALVLKRFPLSNRKAIFIAINGKIKEIKASLGRSSQNRTRQPKQY